MSVMVSQLRNFNSKYGTDNWRAVFFYPKLVIFEGHRIIHNIDVESKHEESSNTDFVHELDQDIVDYKLEGKLLWLLLQSGDVLVLNVLTNSFIKLILESFAGHKIIKLRCVNNSLYLTSESGNCWKALLVGQDVNENFLKGVTEMNVNLERTSLPHLEVDLNEIKYTNGMEIFLESGNVYLKCPDTGLHEIIYSTQVIEHAVPYSEDIVIASKCNMWMVNLKESVIKFNFDKVDGNYYPITVSDDTLYFIVWDNLKIQVFCAWDTEMIADDDCKNESTINKSLNKLSQDTLKAQLQHLIDSAISNSSPPEQVSLQLKTLYTKIEDISYLLENTSKLCEHNIVYKVLLHALQGRIYSTNNYTHINQLSDLTIKVDLLEYILFRGITIYDNTKLFEQTCKQLCIMFISKSDFDLASLCWLKYSQTMVKLAPNDVIDILDAVPQNIKMGTLIIWLKNFVPSLLDENPYFIDVFVKWTTKRVFLLESSNYWPKVGLKFIDEIVTVLEKSLKTIIIRPISMDDLDVLKDHIRYIIELAEKYKINMLLGEIRSQNHIEVALIMLRRCYTEDLSAFLNKFLSAYTTRYQCELDEILRSFIENEAASCGGGIDSARLTILIEAFRTPSNKLDCLLQILKVLDVPWDDTVIELAVSVAGSVFKDFTVTESDRILAQEIQQQMNYAKVKVVLKKYNFPMTCNDYVLVLHKMINAPTFDLNDLKVITNVVSAYKNYGSILFINRCLQECDTRTALNFFNNRPRREKGVLLRAISNKYEQIVNGTNNDPRLERNYLDFLKGTTLLNNIQIKDLENLYHLKNSFKVPLYVNTIYDEKYCRDKTDTWIRSDGIVKSCGRGRFLLQLSQTEECQSQSGLILLLRRTSTSNQIRKIVEQLISFRTSESTRMKNVCEAFNYFKNDHNSSLLFESFDIMVELLANCNEENIHFLTRTLSTLNALINTKFVIKNLSIAWKFYYVFLPFTSVNATNDLIDFYSKMLSKGSIENACVNVANKNDFIAIRFLSHALETATLSDELNLEVFKMKGSVTKRLISKVIAFQSIDEILLTSLLLVLNGVEEQNTEEKFWIMDLLQGQNESLSPSLLNYICSPIIRQSFDLDKILPSNVNSHPPQYILKSKFNINLTELSLPDNTEETWDVKVILFYVLRQYPETTFERLVELCHTINVSVNDGLSLQLISLLTTWELKYKVNNNELGCRFLCFENDEKHIISKCFTIWDSVRDKTFLKDVLNDFWKNGEVTIHGRLVSINPYYYEIYMCVYHLIHSSSSETRYRKEYFLLNFLKEYRRQSTPKQYELELFSIKGMFPEIGYYRLPFHLCKREDMWSNLKSEITLETYERWLPAVVLLALDSDPQTARDMICSNALKQTMTSRKRNDSPDEDKKESEPWRLSPREEPLLRAAHRCVRHIANMEWAGACLFYVLQGCARGADQVAAAQLCYQFAQRWAALQPGNRAVRQMERLHSSLSTRHALYKIEWACEDLVRLAAEPSQLIRAMYMHPDFIEKMSRHDVNRAANEIADKNGINISCIRIQILENLLTRSKEDSKNNNSCSLDARKLIVARYILKATCPKMGAIYLSRIAFDDDSDFNKCKKLRALQCLMSVIEQDTAVKVTNRERDELWSSLLDLLYVVNLEDIDMPWLAATIAQDKVRVLEQLLQATVGNISGLKLATELTRRFGNVQFIRQLVPHLLRAGLFEEITTLLLRIFAPPDDLSYTAWRAVLLSPFQRADYPITENQKAKCLNAINLLPVCPIIKDEDLLEIWKNCVRCKCFGLGCLILPYLSVERRETLIELKKMDRRNLIISLKNLQSETYLVSGAMTVLESLATGRPNKKV